MRKFWHSVLLVTLLLAGAWQSSLAQSPETYTGLDVVFLIDQSGSMGGADYGYPDRQATDPLGLRFEAVQYALDTLGQYRLLIAPSLAVRMAVIDFGDKPVVTLNWTPIAESPDTWSTTRQQLLTQISADAFRAAHNPDNLGNTNFMAAFEQAKALFDTLPQGEQHLRVVILLTDGEPCAITGPYQFNCKVPEQKKEHMALVQSLAQDAFPPPDYQVYVLALDSTGQLWERYQGDWQAVVGDPTRATRVESAPEISARFLEILNQLLAQTTIQSAISMTPPQKLAPGENILFVPPYQQQIRLSIFKANSDPAQITVLQPDGQTLQAGNPQLTIANADRPIEVWTITYPSAGTWTFTVQSAYEHLDVYLEMIPLDVKAQVETDNLTLLEPTNITVQLLDSATGQPPVDPSGRFPLTVIAQIKTPQNTTDPVQLTESKPGVYKGVYTPQTGGTYTIGVTAHTTLEDGSTLTLIDVPDAEVLRVGSLTLQVSTWPEGELLVGDTVQFSAVVLDESGQIVTLDTQRLQARLEANQQPISDVEMTGPDAQGVYTAKIPLEHAGTYTAQVRLENTDGVVLDQTSSAPFHVIASDMIRVELLQPKEGASQHATIGFPPFHPNPLEILFETRLDADSSLIDVLALRAEPEADVLYVRVLQEGQPARIVPFQQTERPGRYRATVNELAVGDYVVQIEGRGTLQAHYIFDPVANTVSVHGRITRNPLVYPFYAGMGLLGFLVVALTAKRLVQRRRRQRHPAQGQLAILRVDTTSHFDEEIWRVDLSAYRSNTIHIKRRSLPRDVPITSLWITCDDEHMAKRGAVRVTVKRGKDVLIADRLLAPGQSLPLRTVSTAAIWEDGQNAPVSETVHYVLVKDSDSLGANGMGLGGGAFF